MVSDSKKVRRRQRWYFGGLSSGGAVLFTHPLDTIKVIMQTDRRHKLSVLEATRSIIRRSGISGLYKGIDAAIFRQVTYSGARFGVYAKFLEVMNKKKIALTKTNRLMAVTASGLIGGFLGTPADMVNVRMQNDAKLPPNKRRNYKHVLDGLYRIAVEKGVKSLFKGASFVMVRGVAMTAGQLFMYGATKEQLLKTSYFKDNLVTHFTSSSLAGVVSTCLTHPLDVLKTRMMNAKCGEYKGMFDVFVKTLQTGPLTFFKGLVPSGVRIIPHTIFLFIILEQLTKNFGQLEE